MKKLILYVICLIILTFIGFSCKKENSGVDPTNIFFLQNNLTLYVGDIDTLKVKIQPSNTTNQNISWNSSNSKVVSVNSSGVIKAIATGIDTITVKTVDGNKAANCTITVLDKWINYNTTNSGLLSNVVSCIIIDDQNNKWFGTLDNVPGVCKYDGSNWTTYLKNNMVYSMALDSQKNIWVGTFGNGIFKFNGSNWLNYYLPDTTEIMDITIDGLNNKWFATNNGVLKFDGTNWTAIDTVNNGYTNIVYSIAIDKQNSIWMGTFGGLLEYNGSWTVYNIVNNILFAPVYTIAIDAKGNKWFGTDGSGVIEFAGTNWNVYSSSNSGLTYNYINCIAIDKQGNKWFGTSFGVYKYDGTNWTLYSSTNSNLINDYITSIAIDKQGNKWFGTENGVSELQDRVVE